MNGSDEAGRISRLCAALGRTTASLDPETVLTEVIEGARALTGAHCGSIPMIDETGAPLDFLTRGITVEEHRAMITWPDGPRLFAHLRDLERPLRLADFPGYVRSLGLSWDLLPLRTFLGTPIRHRGAHVGNFYLIEKEGGEEFTGEDASVQAVRNFVRKLRRKLGDDPAQPAFIHNVRGVGYRMSKPGEA